MSKKNEIMKSDQQPSLIERLGYTPYNFDHTFDSLFGEKWQAEDNEQSNSEEDELTAAFPETQNAFAPE